VVGVDALFHFLVILSFTHQLTDSFTQTFTHSLIHSLSHSLIHSHTHSLTHSFIHVLTHTLTHAFTHSLTHSLIHSLTHSLPHTGRPAANNIATHPTESQSSQNTISDYVIYGTLPSTTTNPIRSPNLHTQQLQTLRIIHIHIHSQ